MPTPVDEFDLTQLPGWESLSDDVRVAFVEAHLPASFLERDGVANFVLGPDLGEVEVPSAGRLVRFGHATAGFQGDFCVNSATGAVLMVMPDIPAVFVNSSLGQLVQTMRLVLRYEHEVTTGDADECRAAVDEIRVGLERIDEPVAHPDSYWSSIAYDMEAGEYSSNDDF